jgi:hypothetical protein
MELRAGSGCASPRLANSGAQILLGPVAPKKGNGTKYHRSFRKETRKMQKEATHAGGYDSEIHAVVGNRCSICIYRRL